MKVVHVKQHPFTHYIGRGWMPKAPTGKTQPVHADLGNPFVLPSKPGLDQDMRKDVCDRFETWARSKPEVMERIKTLPANAVLGCWCAPKACHGDVIVKLWKEMHGE